MIEFPSIGCRAVAQYPSSFEISRPTVVQTYVDGGEQRFSVPDRILRSWSIRLERLSEEDANRVWDFFESNNGCSSSFRFQDPWTSQWHEPCWFDQDSLAFQHLREGVFQGELQIHCAEG